MANYPSVVVPAIPPRPPQVNLLTSAVIPDTTSDPANVNLSDIPADQLASLPEDLRLELEARQGDAWIRGFTYAPENHFHGEVRDPCDFSSIDLPALAYPAGLALTAIAGGTLVAATYEYQVTALNANGETQPSPTVSITTTATGSIEINWDAVVGASQYRVYGRVAGSIGLLATVNGTTWTDNGSVAVGAVPPTSNTTGGVGSYSNAPIVVVQPWLVVVEDFCSSFGWQERDFKGRALRLLENATPKAIENEFWTGALATAKGYPNNFLTNVNSVTNLTPATIPSVARGLQILQDALAQKGFGGQGMIHVQAQTAPNLLGARRVGQLLLDIFDNIIVPGVGYTGSGPGNVAPAAGTAYMYATDLVMVREQETGTVFPDTFAEAIDWGQAGAPNTIRFRAEKFVAAYADFQAHYCVQVNLPT